MKIYFENGRLLSYVKLPAERYYIVNARDGYSPCEETLRWIKDNDPEAVVYTNQITALSNFYAWNDELNAPEIYMRNEECEFTRIDELAYGKIRRSQNVMAMFRAGVFGNILIEEIK